MSSKTKTTATNEDARRALVPKLRFPEFRKLDGWNSMTLGEVTTKTDKKNKGGKSYPVYSISNKTGFTPQSEQFKGVDSEKRGYDISLYKLIESKTFAYNPARINVGSIGYSGDLNNIIISSLYVCFKAMSEAVDQFLLHFFSTSEFERSVSNLVEGGIRSYLFYENFARIPIALPSRPEQQKIAECLSSVDQMIDAQARKLDVLKTYKKGLMQQLFPREGETQPPLRFPEIQNARQWTVESLGKVCAVLNNRRRPITSSNRKPGPYRYYGASGVVDYVDDYIFDERVVLVGEDGAKWGAFEGTAFIAEGKFWVNNHAHVLKPHGVNDTLLENYLTMIDLGPFVTGAAPPKLTLGKLKEIPVPIPPNKMEGEAIAKCLNSLDDLIAAETQKLEVLKIHKKGLMQQLFPSAAEAVT